MSTMRVINFLLKTNANLTQRTTNTNGMKQAQIVVDTPITRPSPPMPLATVGACLEIITTVVIIVNVVTTVYMTVIVPMILPNATAEGEFS